MYFDEQFKPFPKKKWFTKSYIFDWVITLIIEIIEELLFQIPLFPVYQRFKIWMHTIPAEISYPHSKDIFPWWLLILLSTLFPAIIFLIFQIWQKSLHDLHHSLLRL